MQRKWYLAGLPMSRAIEFKKFLEKQGIEFEQTESLNLVYFDYCVNEHQYDTIANWLKESRLLGGNSNG